MAIDRTKLQSMYKLMADNGYTQDYNTFEKKFTGDSNYANRKAVYDLFTQNGADLGGSYEEFMRKLQKPRATKPQQQPKTALGRAQQSVAQQKWGGYVSEEGRVKSEESYGAPTGQFGRKSELVRGLENADAAQRLQRPVEYENTVKGIAQREVARRKAVGRAVESAGREAAKAETVRRNAPAFNVGNESANKNIVKTQGQLEDDMNQAGEKLAAEEFGGYISNAFKKEEEAAFERGQNAAENFIAASPTQAVFGSTSARNEEMSPEKRLANITKDIENNIQTIFSSPKLAERINAESAKLGVSPEYYAQKTLIPSLMSKVASDFDKTELKNLLPKGSVETILMHAQNSMTGALASMGLMTKEQRQYGQRALTETLEGNNPYYNPGLGTKVTGSTLSFMMDAFPIGLAEKPAAMVAGKLFGNGVAQTARIANSTLGGRIARMAGSGMVSQGITGVLYGSTNAAVQNYSTGDDTSIGNTVKVMAMGGLSEGASWATMGGIGGAVGAGIYKVSGVKRIPAKAFQLAMEGIGMHIGGNVAKTIEGHDTDWTSIEGNLEACANVVALKLTHARLPKRQSKDGIKESYLDMVARNINGLMTSDGQRAAFGGYTFTNEEKEQLFGSASAPKRNESIYGYDAHNNPLTRKESLTSWAMRAKKTAAKGKGEESYKDTDAEFVKTAYDEIMADNTIPWDTKAKFSALVMGTVPSARPMMENCRIEGGSVNEYSKNGELLSKNSFKSIDERNSIIYSLNMKREDQRLSNAYGAAQIKDEKTAQATLEAVAEANGMTAEQLKAAMDKQPLRRSDEEQNACVALRKAYEDEQFVPGTLHAEQSNTEGKDVVEENGLGTETPNNEAASEVLGDLTKTEDALQAAMDSNDVLKEEYERMQKAGMSNPQIYMELFNSGLTQEQLAPLADYINALSKAQGMFKGTQDKIVETTQKHVGQWSYKGELNGEKQNGEQMVFVKDDKGRVLIVGAGDVAFDGEGRVRDGDMLSVYDPATREMDFVHAKDVTLEHTATSEEYAKDYQRQLEELNSTVYAEMQSGGEEEQPSLTEPAEPTKPKGEEGNEASLGLSKPTKPLGEKETIPVGEKETIPVGEKETTPVGEEPVATLADGTPVPMMKDSKGRETADYSQMSPEQGAEWMSSQFGENAEAAVDGQIKRAEKTLKDAEKIKVDYTGDLNDAKEAEAQKKIAIEAAKAELELYTNIKKAMTEKKVKAGMEKVSSVGSVGVAREKFESGLRVVGNKRTRTLADGTKLKGHYEIVEADSLTPSHNANDGYKKSEGFPVNEEGRTINDRDYENDKQAQLVTDMIAMKYDGQAVDQVPVVTSDGIVVDGNGRTIAGQKAAKNGTDSAYLEALKENAENYGFTAEQIEQSGIKHPRLVLVSDEPMKYDTATFAKFNKNEKKAQGNTQQAVANSKKLSADEISAIVSEIEGSGSLDAFFNNPSAINSLLTRLVDKGVIGLNEVAGLREGEDKLSAAGKDFVKNLLLGSVFSENTIRMMGADAMLKTKALNGIRAVTDNMKLGDYALMKEIDQAVQLLYEARQGGSGVDAYLRTPAMFGENAADRFDPISQAIALALEGKVEDFRELMMAYNRNAAPYADANQTEMFGERPTKEDFVNEFLKLRNWEDYETRHSSKEGNGDAGSSERTEPQARGGSEPTEGEGLGSRGNTGQGENIDVIPAKKDSGTHVKNTEGESGNVGLGSTDKGSRNNEGQREVDKAEEEKSDKPSEASLGLTKPGEQPGEKSEGAKPVGDGKEPKANPLDGMRKAAELFKDEQITKARAELAEAKKSGDASEVKRLTDKLKGLMDSTLRGKGIGLVERRKIIGEELGKAEAEKIDKPWADMEFDEQVAETEKKPLDADEIKNSDCDGVDKANAVAYLNGDKNIINTLSYLTVYDNVRNRERDSVPSSGTEDGTQLDAADNAGGEGLGRTDSRPQGVDSGQLGRTEGDGNPERGESVQSGERVSGGESGEVHATAAVGERGGEQIHGGASRVEPVSTGGTKPRGSRGVRGTGRDVRERGNEGSGNFSDEKAGEATGGRGIDSRNLSTVEQIDKEISDTQSLVDDLFNSLFDGRTKGSIISDRTNASIIPLASDHLLGKLGINKQKMAVYKQLIPALTKLGYLHIKKGVVKLNDWIDAMKGSFGGHLTKLGLSDEEVYDYIKNMWNSNIEVDGVTHKLSEWASILGTERMKKEIATPNAEKYKRQVAAEPIKVKVGDMKNIEETLPFLLPQQQEDVLRAETQFFGKEHADREHAYGKGYMFTNGTGTGKTFTGLGIAKRLVKQGKGRILIVTPSQKKVSDWIKDGRNLNMEIRDLDSIAKERGTTATTESGEGVVITTFANFGLNKKLLETKWDAVIYDESHRIMENKKGAETARSMQHYMVTNRDENRCFLRLQEISKDYQKMKDLGEQFDAERDKEVKRIQDEYKASHPSATNRDVAYATYRMLPKEIQGFTPGDYASFPKLGKIHGEYMKAFSHYVNDVKPKLEAQAKNEWKDTKTIFLSATPFNTRENLDYAEGYIFKYPEGEKGGRMSGRTQFYLDHFGAAYKFRYNRLEQSTSNPEAVAKQEIAFSDYLQHTLGTMSGRIIDSPYDYSRDFPTVSSDHAETFNQAVQEAVRGHEVLAKAYNQTIGDYNYGSALFETMKVANIIERIKAHLDAGRKVVIFHRRVETKEPLKPPFASMLEQANRLIAMMKPGEEQKKAIKAVKDFRKKYADLLEWEQTLDYSMPREQIAKVFGKDKVLFFSGKESTKAKDKAVDTFNSDDSGKNIIVIQEASGKEGISLHDKTGKHQRVCITLALPQSPITALQIEGRTYRIGNKSNAIFEYPILGLNSEMMLFGQKFNNQVSTTENLALGSKARSLRDSFANGILEHSGVVPIDQQGVGGKEFDAPKDQSTDGFDNAVLDYYSNQKLNSRNREGVDYFPTPEPLGYKMMEWANMGEGDTVLEPSAGHGAIARYAPKGNQMVAIEPSQSLFTKLQLKAGGLGRKFQNTIFENYDISNKHDVVVMNPPFGTAGATAIAHLGKAFKHLEEGGRVVALIPRGSTDKKFEKWIEGEKTAVMRAEVALPDIVFKQAGTNVVCRVVVVDKISNKAMRAKAGSVEKWDLGGHYDKIEDFFEDLRDVEMPDRIIDTNAIMMKKSKQTVKDLKELKDARVDFNEGGINVRVRGDWKDYSIPFDMEGYSAEQKKKFLASTYETFEQQERQTRNETSQAVLDELKKLTCKLADMTEEEMQRYLKKKSEGKGVMENIAHSAEVYNNAKKLRFQKAPKEEQSEELYLSLQNKKGKEYYDTVDILSERIADGRADIRGLSERPGRKEANRISAGIEIIAASRDKQNEAGTAKSNETKLRLGRVATEKAIEEWAKSNDAVFAEEDIAKGAMDGKPSAEGGEAVVYVSNDFSKVTKLVDPYPRNNGSIQLCMENTRLFNRLFPDAAYTVKGVARDKNGKFRIVMEQPYLEGKQYGEDTMAEYENGPSQAKDALMESLGLHDVYGDGLEFRNDKYYVSDLHPGNIVFDSEGQPHVIDADVKYYGVFRRNNIEGKPLIADNEAKEPKTDARSSEEFFKSLKDKEGKEYYDAVTELAERMAGRTGRKEESVSEGQSQPRETSVGRNTERIVGRHKSVVHCAAEIIATDTRRNAGDGRESIHGSELERGQENARLHSTSSVQSEVPLLDILSQGVDDPVEREISKRIEAWAKQTNHWFDWRNLRTKYDRTKQLGTGDEAESDVFLSKDGKTVLKIVRAPHAVYPTLLDKLNSIALQNKFFNDDAQKIIGITRIYEEGELGEKVPFVGLVMEQPFVDGKTIFDTLTEDVDRAKYRKQIMESMGFKENLWVSTGGLISGWPNLVYTKDGYAFNDVNYGNVIIDRNGKPHIIDCIVDTIENAHVGLKTYKHDEEADRQAALRKIKNLEREILNEEKAIAQLRANRREDNKEQIDEFIARHEVKIADIKKQINVESGNVHYRTDDALDEVNSKFNERLDSLKENPNQKKQELSLGYPGEFLSDAGLGNSEIIVEYSKIVRKSSDTYRNAHPFDISDIKDLPKAINSPIAVFDNTSGNNAGKVILTELKKGDNNFIAVVRATERNRKGGVVLEVNEIRTLFPKESRGIVNWFNTGKTCNVNKEKALTWIEALRTHRGTELTEQELISASNVIKDFDISKQKNINYRIGDNKIENTNSINEITNNRITKAIDKAVEKTGGKVKMVNTVEEIGNEQVRRDIENGKQVTGWYDEATGEVHLYMPNIHDAYTAEKTVWHETVGHKGMRGLLGDKFNDYMRGLWMDLDNPVNAELKAYVKERMNKDSMGFYDAIEEFIAESAEKGKGEPGFWNNIKNKVTDALHEIGYRISPNVKDVKYMLWLAKNVQKKGNDPWWKMRADAVKWKIEHENDFSITEENGMLYDNNGKKHGLLDLNKKDFDEATDGRVHYRTSPMAASKIEEYNRRLSTKWYAFRESTVDDMQSLQEAMQIISGVKDAYTDIPSAFNPLLCHNRMGSMVMQMCERYDRECTEPLGDAFKKVVSAMPGKDGAEQMRNANLYFIKKHGLERNRVLFVRDWISEERRTKSEESNSIDALESAWNGEKNDLGQKLRSGQIDLREYYRQMDEWIVQNIDKDFKAGEHDYSGMHGIYDVKKGEEYDDANVIDEVMSTESQLGADLVKSFWDAKKKATDFTIDQEYANGKKDRAERDHLKEMFDWYVPLRKFDDTVAEDVYGYISGGDTKNYIGSVIEKARGRESLSDVNVLAQISALAKSSIINGGKNVEKQHFMRFVEVYEKGDAKDRIFVEIKPWVEKHTVDGNEVWEEVMPNIPENSTQEQINEILNTFETTMKAKQAKGEAKIARRKSDIGYKFERSSDMNQHIVNVYVNGRVRRFVCQGNPRAAQAINGLLRDSGTQHWAMEQSAKLNRICAQLNTSLNPDFVSSNLMRDLTSASANLTKEGMGYTWDFCKEYAKNWGSMVRRKDGNFDGGYLGMFRRYKEGRLDANNQKERWFKEFMDNGGETGFVSLKKYEDIIKEYENLVKTGNKDGDRWLMKKLKEGGALVELANEVVENVARYSTYCVSRKRGRSIGKSIYDAKEVSSNFNRHGSGDAVKSLKTKHDGKTNTAFRKSVGWFNSYMKNHTMFYNAGVQGANLFAKNIKHAPKTTAIAFGAMPFGLNIAVALLNQLLISQEDEKKRNGVKNPYAELPEWKRRNNLCIYWGGGNFKTIPMGIELRAFYGLGDIAAGYMVDERLKSDTPIGFDIIGQMAQLVPASDFLGHHSPSSGIKESLEDVALSVTPTVAKPGLELAFNRNWTGRPIYRDKDYLDRAPRWKSAYDNTNDVYMTINKWANKTFNGIDDTNEDLKGSGMMADAADFFTAPYGLQHIVEGYTGGTGATIGRTYQTGKSLVNGVVSGIKDDKGFKEGFKKEWKNVDPNSIPFYRVFNYTPKEGNDMQRTKSKWYNYVNELEQLKYNKRQMKTNTSDVVMNIHNAATKYKFSKTKEGKMLRIYEAADKYITAKNKLLKRAKDQTVINSINEDINRKMQEAVADLDRISDD